MSVLVMCYYPTMPRWLTVDDQTVKLLSSMSSERLRPIQPTQLQSSPPGLARTTLQPTWAFQQTNVMSLLGQSHTIACQNFGQNFKWHRWIFAAAVECVRFLLYYINETHANTVTEFEMFYSVECIWIVARII